MNNKRFNNGIYPNIVNSLLNNNSNNNLLNNVLDNNSLFNNNQNTITNNNNLNNNLANINEGYLKGNLFNDIYSPYKNYNIARLVPNNEKAESLLNLNMLDFASHELRLYLDVYPTDQNMINLFNQYVGNSKEALENYESRFGPISNYTPSANNIFSWESYNFPWDEEVR